MELISVEKTEELFPNWYGSEETDVWDGMYYLAWNNDIYHDGSFGKADYSNDGILCTMIFRMKKDMEIDELTIYVDSANPIANIMNWEMEDYLHKNTTDSIYGENDFLFTSGVVAFVEEYGDINFDGIVNVLDAVYLFSHVYDAEGYPIDKNVDYNQDNKITEADALYLLRHTIIPERYPIS